VCVPHLLVDQCTHVVEYARETYFKTGSDLLDSIAVVHPFIISTLLSRVETAIGAAGEVGKGWSWWVNGGHGG